MQFARKIFILTFALVIFAGAVGVDVFSHFCKVDGLELSYIVPSDVCKTELESCCHAADDKHVAAVEIKQNCCEESISSFRIANDYIQKTLPQLVVYAIIPQSSPFYFVAGDDEEISQLLTAQITRPPPKTGQQILVLNQIFRI